MVTSRTLPADVVAGMVRAGSFDGESRRWVEVHRAALDRLGVVVGDKVMLYTSDGDNTPGVVADAGDGVLAVFADAPQWRDNVVVRRRRL